MNHNKSPLLINVGFLLNQQVGVSRDIHFEYPEYFLHPDLNMFDFTGVLRISRTNTGLLAQGDFRGLTQVQCVRCLEDYSHNLSATFSELYGFKGKEVSESGLVVPDDANIDFEPLVWEYLTLEIPINLVCKQDCKGLCIVCGENQNLKTCAHDVDMDMEKQ